MEPVTVKLDTPIQRGEQTIDSVSLRRPVPKDLEGFNIRALSNMDAGPMTRFLPLVTNPPLLEHEVATMDVGDYVELAVEVSHFLLRKAYRASS